MKHRTVLVSDEAVDDLDAGKAFYDIHGKGLGDYFIDSLSFFAGIHVQEYGYFKMLSKRFPFSIYYDIKEENVLIIAILDMRRNPLMLYTSIQSRK